MACDHGRAAECARLASFYALGEDAPDDIPRALPVLERGAAAGDARASLLLGALYLRGHGVPADPARAAALLARACDAGLAVGCFVLARSYRSGRVGPPDVTDVEALERRAYEGGLGGSRVHDEAAERCGRGDLEASPVFAALRALQPAFQACYERDLARDPTLSGRVEIDFTIGCTGRVRGSPRTWGLWRAQDVGDCIGEAIRSAVFPSASGATEFTFPIGFTHD